MVFPKTLDYGFIGYHPPLFHLPKSAKGKRSARKKMCAIDMLAAVAGKLLLEKEGSLGSSRNTRVHDRCNQNIKQEHADVNNPLKNEAFDLGSCCESTLGSNAISLGIKHDVDPHSMEDRMDVDAKPHPFVSSDRCVKVPLCGGSIIRSKSSPNCWEEKLAVNRDDDENSCGTLKPQGLGECRISNQLASKVWKVAPTIRRDRELSNTDVDMKLNFYRRKICYARHTTRRSLFKRRKFVQRCAILASVGGSSNKVNRVSSSIHGRMSYKPEDFHVKLSIKSFKVPELFIEVPETSTIASLKRTVMETVTAILGGGLRIGVLVQGKKVRDDSKTLLQAGISHGDKLDDVGFTLEPCSNPVVLASPKEQYLLPPFEVADPLTRLPSLIPPSNGVKFDDCTESSPSLVVNCSEGEQDSVRSLDKTTANTHALIAIPSMGIETQPTAPVRKPRRTEIGQRRIRRPFSVTEVEALVHAVEKLGTGRWRDVKIRAFDSAKHRTYVDLKDKWKTLVHTARISPQQRRGEPVPQELLDRVLAAHAYWSHLQSKLQVKSALALI